MRRFGSESGAGGFQVGVGMPGSLTSYLIPELIEALTPRADRKQRQVQLALSALADLYPTVSKMSPNERKKFYPHFFSAYGTMQPPKLQRLFGAKEEAILPLPEDAVELEGGEKMRTPGRGRISSMPSGVRVPVQSFEFEEHPDVAEERRLRNLQIEQLTEESKSREEQRRQPKPWAPTTKEEYKEVHTPQRGYPFTEEEHKDFARFQAGLKTPAQLQHEEEKKRQQRLATLKYDKGLAADKLKSGYTRYIKNLSKEVDTHNKRMGEEHKLEDHPDFMTQWDWERQNAEGQKLSHQMQKLDDEIYYLETGKERAWDVQGAPLKWKPITSEGVRKSILAPPTFSSEPQPFNPKSTTPLAPPSVRGQTPQKPQGNQIKLSDGTVVTVR